MIGVVLSRKTPDGYKNRNYRAMTFVSPAFPAAS